MADNKALEKKITKRVGEAKPAADQTTPYAADDASLVSADLGLAATRAYIESGEAAVDAAVRFSDEQRSFWTRRWHAHADLWVSTTQANGDTPDLFTRQTDFWKTAMDHYGVGGVTGMGLWSECARACQELFAGLTLGIGDPLTGK